MKRMRSLKEKMRKTIWHYKIRKSCLPLGWPTGKSSDTPLAGAWAMGEDYIDRFDDWSTAWQK